MSAFRWLAFGLFLSVHALCSQEFTWEKSQDGFFVRMVIAATRLPIDSSLTAQLTLKYPVNYAPDIKAFRNNFLRYTGQGIPPFALVKEEKKEISGETVGTIQTEIIFTLSPQAVGNYALMFQAMPFLHKSAKIEAVEVPLPLVEIEITGAPPSFAWQALMAPPLNVTQDFPVEISQKNKYAYMLADELSKKELARSVDILQKKALPWIPFLALVALGFAYFIVKMSPPPKQKEGESSAEMEWRAALKELQTVTAMAQEKTDYQANFVRLDHALRHYFEGKYSMAASTSTTQEFLQIIAHSPKIDGEMRGKLAQFLVAAERVKYAHHIPTDEEYAHVVALAQNIMEKVQFEAKDN